MYVAFCKFKKFTEMHVWYKIHQTGFKPINSWQGICLIWTANIIQTTALQT